MYRLLLLFTLALLTGCAVFNPQPTPTPAPTLPPPTPTKIPYDTPEWFRDAVLYQIFVRSFYDSNGDGIGDLDGITQQLDYIQSLGANTLWLTPIFASPSYHGYDTTDYYTINPDFGTKDDLIELVDAAHARGMYIILDYVASHTSNEHPFFKDAYANPDSEYSDWYLWRDEKHLTYQSFFGITTLPTINHASDAANAYFFDVARYWLDLDGDGDYTDGIDGWRCDYALGSPHGFWEALRQNVKAVDPDALLLGEVWVDDALEQVPYYEDEFDALFDFPLFIAMMNDIERGNDGALHGQTFASIPIDVLNDQSRLFPEEAIPVRFLSNHDTDRLATELAESPERLYLAPLLLAALPGVPMIYYGEEIGMEGHKGGGPIYDEYRREPMNWHAANGPGTPTWFPNPRYSGPNDGVSVEEQDADPNSLLNAYRAAFALRRANPALLRGDYTWLRVNPRPGVWAFWRHYEGQIVAALFNLGLTPTTVSLDLSTAPAPLGDAPTNLLTGEPAEVDPEAVTLEPGSALILDWSP